MESKLTIKYGGKQKTYSSMPENIQLHVKDGGHYAAPDGFSIYYPKPFSTTHTVRTNPIKQYGHLPFWHYDFIKYN